MTSIFCPSKLRQTKHVQTTSIFRLSKLRLKKFLEMTWKFVDIFFRPIDVISTSNRRQFDVLCLLGTQLFIVPPVVVRLEVFQSQRPKNHIKPTLKSSEKVTLNQPAARGTGQT